MLLLFIFIGNGINLFSICAYIERERQIYYIYRKGMGVARTETDSTMETGVMGVGEGSVLSLIHI